MKRRRPADSHKQRPSLDLAKMTQKLQNFQSLSCPGITGEEDDESDQAFVALRHAAQSGAGERGPEDAVQPRTKEGGIATRALSDPTIEEADWSSVDCGELTPEVSSGQDGEPLWAGLCSMTKDTHQLGGELDIEQIERN